MKSKFSFLFLKAALLAGSAGFFSCVTIAHLGRDYSGMKPGFDRRNVLAIAYLHKNMRDGNPPYFALLAINNGCAQGSFGFSPFPVDYRGLRAPVLWEPDDVIHDSYNRTLTVSLNQRMENNVGELPQSRVSGKSIQSLLELAREKNMKYLYLVRFNLYRQISTGARNWTTTYSGFIPSASRILLHVETGKALVIRENPSEKYVWFFLLVNGFDNKYGRFNGHVTAKAVNYANRVGAKDLNLSMRRMAKYLSLMDFTPHR